MRAIIIFNNHLFSMLTTCCENATDLRHYRRARVSERDNYENRDVRLVGREVRGNRGSLNRTVQRSRFALSNTTRSRRGRQREAVHTVSIRIDQTVIASPVGLPRLTAAQRKRQKGAEGRHARQDAAEWVEAHHPEEVCLIAELGKWGTKGTPWKAIPLVTSWLPR